MDYKVYYEQAGMFGLVGKAVSMKEAKEIAENDNKLREAAGPDAPAAPFVPQ
jgi:hypothetical protein